MIIFMRSLTPDVNLVIRRVKGQWITEEVNKPGKDLICFIDYIHPERSKLIPMGVFEGTLIYNPVDNELLNLIARLAGDNQIICYDITLSPHMLKLKRIMIQNSLTVVK